MTEFSSWHLTLMGGRKECDTQQELQAFYLPTIELSYKHGFFLLFSLNRVCIVYKTRYKPVLRVTSRFSNL